MKCIICHGTEIEKKKVNEETIIENDIVYIPVDVLVCKTCGERYYDRETKRYLEDTFNKLKLKNIELKEIGKIKMLAV
jgi:YgiT-type zinc finger domain-containing protein